MVFVQSELWSAVSDNGPLDADTEIVVTGVDGLLLHVQPLVARQVEASATA
jgi:membrane protein implicated in regulation of membrane protease activity